MPRQRRGEAGCMFTTYILHNTVTSRSYIGSTNDLSRRVEEHNRGQTRSTKTKGKWVVIYEERFKTSLESKRRERQIKSYKGGEAFKKLVCGYSIPVV